MRTTRKFPAQRGITMVESLVALVVLSVGMLGIASLYIASLKAGRSAMIRTQAVNLATDIADRIRSNRAGRGAYDTAGYGGGAKEHGCVGGTCSADELAEDDLARWQTTLTQVMPGNAKGIVTYLAEPVSDVNQYTIVVSWRESGDTADSTTQLVMEL